MRKYVYDNAVVYISTPTEDQLQNIRDSTKRYVRRVVAGGFIINK